MAGNAPVEANDILFDPLAVIRMVKRAPSVTPRLTQPPLQRLFFLTSSLLGGEAMMPFQSYVTYFLYQPLQNADTEMVVELEDI